MRSIASQTADAAALLLAAGLLAPAAAQDAGLTVQQVQSRFHGMNAVHILKCDHDGNGLFDRGEMACVSSIYRVMYLDD